MNHRQANFLFQSMSEKPCTVNLKSPLDIDVKSISTSLAGLRYRGPYKNLDGELVTSEYVQLPDYTHALVFDAKTEQGFTTLRTNVSIEMFRAIVHKIPDSNLDKKRLIAALSGTILDCSDSSAERDDEKLELTCRLATTIEEFRKVWKTNSNYRLNKHHVYAVAMGEIAMTHSSGKQRILATFGAGSCLIVALYNPATKEAALAHLDAFSKIESLNKYIVKMKRSSSSDEQNGLRVYLAGGHKSSASQSRQYDLIRLLENHSDVKIVGCGFDSGTTDLAIDSENGEIWTHFNHKDLDNKNFVRKCELRTMSFAKTDLWPVSIDSMAISHSQETKDVGVSLTSCGHCFAQNVRLRCTRCKAALYCDQTCQLAHWRNGHKGACVDVKGT